MHLISVLIRHQLLHLYVASCRWQVSLRSPHGACQSAICRVVALSRNPPSLRAFGPSSQRPFAFHIRRQSPDVKSTIRNKFLGPINFNSCRSLYIRKATIKDSNLKENDPQKKITCIYEASARPFSHSFESH